MQLEDLLDDRNRELLNKMKAAGLEIELATDASATTWSVKEVIRYKITAPSAKPNIGAFTHELLHIMLDLAGFADVLTVYKKFNESNSIFTPEFIGTLNNDLAHYKMFGSFVSMGFSPHEFLPQTPKESYSTIYATTIPKMILAHKTKSIEPCELIRHIVIMCASAKLSDLYNNHDKDYKNGMDPQLVFDPLKEINKPLVEALDTIFSEWARSGNAQNLSVYEKLNDLFNSIGYKSIADCQKNSI